jgi:MG2 domain/Putative glutamine amidotransferase
MSDFFSGFAQLRFGVPGGPPLAAVLALIACALIILGIREHRALPAGGRRKLLHALRIASVCTALLYALRPEWVVQRVEQLPGRIAVLLDASRSMLVRDGSQERLALAVAAVQRFYDDALDKPALFAFGQDLAPLQRANLTAAELVPRDDTRIERAIATLAAQSSELGAVLLVSDGADRSPHFDPADLQRTGLHVHTLMIGDAASRPDLAIQSVRVDAAAFLRQSVEVEVVVRRTPPTAAEPVTLTLRNGSELIRETSITFDPDGIGTARLAFTPERLGRAVYTLTVPTDVDDAVPENNERAFQLQVTRERLRALLVCGHPSWDARFLRALLKGDPAVDLITFFILRTQNDNSVAPPEELSLIPFPTEELFEQHLKSFDLVIFQDFDFGPYQMARYLPRIHDYVMGGGSFAMLGGDRSFGAGGYADTPIAEILPVRLPDRPPYLDEAEFSPSVVAEAAHHPLVELVPRVADNLNLWQQLAPLAGADRVDGLRPGAHALLVHPTLTTSDGQPMPVLSVFTPGRGRALALTTDSSYRWGMGTAGRTGDASVYERFWDRALRWLARDPMLDPAQITTDRASYGPGASVRVQVWLRDELYRARTPGPFRLKLSDARGQITRELPVETDADGRATLALNAPPRPAAYTLSVFAEGASQSLAEQGFIVEAGGDELADPRARPDLMQRIAAATGGQYFAGPSQLPASSALPSTRTRVLGSELHAPFASGWVFALFIVFAGSEWWVRRRSGLR